MKRPTRAQSFCASRGMAAILVLWRRSRCPAQPDAPPPRAPRAARISAPKPPAAAVRHRLHRRRLPQGAAGPGQEPWPVRARQLPARALHQQPRERGGAGRLSAADAGPAPPRRATAHAAKPRGGGGAADAPCGSVRIEGCPAARHVKPAPSMRRNRAHRRTPAGRRRAAPPSRRDASRPIAEPAPARAQSARPAAATAATPAVAPRTRQRRRRHRRSRPRRLRRAVRHLRLASRPEVRSERAGTQANFRIATSPDSLSLSLPASRRLGAVPRSRLRTRRPPARRTPRPQL